MNVDQIPFIKRNLIASEEIHFDENISFSQTRDIKDWKPVLEGLVDVFGYSYYHTILSWCDIVDNSSIEDFWEVWAVKLNGNIIGICGLYSHHKANTDELWLGWLGIIPEQRNKGIGEKVLSFLIYKCQEYKCKTLLSYVDKDGRPLNFYYRNGFINIGTVDQYIADKPDIAVNFSEYFTNKEDYVITRPIEKKFPDKLKYVHLSKDLECDKKWHNIHNADMPEAGKVYTVRRFFYYKSPISIKESKWAVQLKELNHGDFIGYDARYFESIE